MYTPAQRLLRSRNDKVIAGVAGGVATYLAIDPVIVRLIFIALIFTGVGIILYPILWFVMPIEPEASATIANRPLKEGREVFVASGSTPNRVRFDPMIDQPNDPNDAGEEVPIKNAGPSNTEPDPRTRRNQWLGYALLIVGGIILISTFAGLSGLFAKVLFPVILIGIGVYLLRRNQ